MTVSPITFYQVECDGCGVTDNAPSCFEEMNTAARAVTYATTCGWTLRGTKDHFCPECHERTGPVS